LGIGGPSDVDVNDKDGRIFGPTLGSLEARTRDRAYKLWARLWKPTGKVEPRVERFSGKIGYP
jgi:hypothetical protein